jgi:subtilisin family serine protease
MADPKANRNGERTGRGAGKDGAGPAGILGRYLVALRPQGIRPDIDRLAESLTAEPGVRVLDMVGRTGESTDGAGAPVWAAALVVEAPPPVAAQWMASPQLIVEPDAPLAYTHPNPIAFPLAAADPAVVVAGTEEEQITIVVRGPEDVPVPGAAVYVAGGAWPVSGITDANGRLSLRMPAATTITALWVRPRSGYWPTTVSRPQPGTRGEYVVAATPLDATFDGFPKRKAIGWARQALRLHEVAPNLRGHGVKIALIDSGVADKHPDLDGQIVGGVDLISGAEKGWAADPLGHGTACAGIIAASDSDSGIDGVAVDAELLAYKVMPGGHLSHLLKALDLCIRQQVDVAQISVGALAASEIVALKIAEARAAGVLCVAAAGNTGAGPVTFPANLPTVLAVGAVGQIGTLPPDGFPIDPMLADIDGLFVPGFTAAGHEVDVCAPGVAVLTTAPPDGYAMLDGCGVAAAHITALAGLVLAHHDDFRTRFTRGPARVDRLAHLISASCRPLAAARARTGAGMPNARNALASIEPIPMDWTGAVLSQLNVDLARAGLIPSGPMWTAGWPAQQP